MIVKKENNVCETKKQAKKKTKFCNHASCVRKVISYMQLIAIYKHSSSSATERHREEVVSLVLQFLRVIAQETPIVDCDFLLQLLFS